MAAQVPCRSTYRLGRPLLAEISFRGEWAIRVNCSTCSILKLQRNGGHLDGCHSERSGNFSECCLLGIADLDAANAKKSALRGRFSGVLADLAQPILEC